MALKINQDSLSPGGLGARSGMLVARVAVQWLEGAQAAPLVDTRQMERGVMDRLVRITTAIAVAMVAAVAAVISYWHAYELVSACGETGVTARLVPFTVDGLILLQAC